MNNTAFFENAINDKDEIRLLPNRNEYSTYEEMQREQKRLIEIAKIKIKQMTESFDLEMFYNAPRDMIAVIVITQNQVVIVYGDEKIYHDEIIPIIKKIILKKDNNSRIIIRCAKTKILEIFFPKKRGQISKQMSELMKILYNKLEIINRNKIHKANKIEITKLNFNSLLYTAMNIMKKNNNQPDKEIVGIELEEYIKKIQREQEDELEF